MSTLQIPSAFLHWEMITMLELSFVLQIYVFLKTWVFFFISFFRCFVTLYVLHQTDLFSFSPCRRLNSRISLLALSGWMVGWTGSCWILLSAKLSKWDAFYFDILKKHKFTVSIQSSCEVDQIDPLRSWNEALCVCVMSRARYFDSFLLNCLQTHIVLSETSDFHGFFFFFLIQVYITKVDPTSSLGLSTDSVYSYRMGHIKRVLGGEAPETQPSRCMSRGPSSITVALKGLNKCSSTINYTNNFKFVVKLIKFWPQYFIKSETTNKYSWFDFYIFIYLFIVVQCVWNLRSKSSFCIPGKKIKNKKLNLG